MSGLTWTYRTTGANVAGFRHLWMKTVTRFDPANHCARCLVGAYEKSFGTRMAVNEAISAAYPAGTVLYLCGVSAPYRWEKNFHLAARVVPGKTIFAPLYNGDVLDIEGLEEIPFDDQAAREQHSSLGEAFLSCRNFQFGVHHFGRS